MSVHYNEMIPIKCDGCGKEIKRIAKLLKSDVRRGRKHHFCNQSCHGKYQAIIKTPEKKSRPKYTCENCGNEFERVKKPKSTCRHIFCSVKCHGEYNRKGLGRDYSRPHPYKDVFILKSPLQFEIIEDKNSRQKRRRKQIKEGLIIPRKMSNRVERIQTKCEGCGKEIERKASEIKKAKHGKSYCSKSCRMRHYNAHILKRTSNQRSKAEDILAQLISSDFPQVKLLLNERGILPDGLEIDLYLPDIKLAIELNGPVHYFPIYGEDRLQRVQTKDIRKKAALQNMKISLISLDISHLQTVKKTTAFLIEHYQNTIKPIIEQTLDAGDGVSPSIASPDLVDNEIRP